MAKDRLNLYTYYGPVESFGRCIADNWTGETVATTEDRARSNLTYQFKVKNGYARGANIKLVGKIKKEDW